MRVKFLLYNPTYLICSTKQYIFRSSVSNRSAHSIESSSILSIIIDLNFCLLDSSLHRNDCEIEPTDDERRFIMLGQQTLNRDFQFILIDISTHLTTLAREMLNTLKSSSTTSATKYILEYDSVDDFIRESSEKITYLFVSSRVADEYKTIPECYGKQMFILEDLSGTVNYKQRFNSDIDLIFQLADELYHCFKKEAERYQQLENLDETKKWEELADKIYPGLKNIYKSLSKQNPIPIKPAAIVWLKHKLQNDNEIKCIQELVLKYVSAFSIFDDDEIQCKEYLLENQSSKTIFLIISGQSITLQDFPHITNIYHYENVTMKYSDLCSDLISDLADWYYKLASTYRNQNHAKTAKEMFVKSHELYKILAALK